MPKHLVRRLVSPALAAFCIAALMVAGAATHHSDGARAGFDTGALQGTVLWNGEPIDARLTNGPCGLTAVVGSSTQPVGPGGSYLFPVLPEGTYAPLLRPATHYGYIDGLASGAPATVTAGTTTTADIDTTNQLGLVTGLLEVEGAPLGSVTIKVNYAGVCGVTDGDGTFALLLPSGSYGGAVDGRAFTFDVTAGQTTALGAIEPQLTDQPATVQGTVLFNGAPYVPVGASDSSCGMRVSGQPVSSAGAYSYTTGSDIIDTNNVMRFGDSSGFLQFGGGNPAWVARGVTTTTDIVLDTSQVGIVVGSVTVNGAPLPGAKVYPYHWIGSGCVYTDSTGSFKFPWYGGANQTAYVRLGDGTELGSFTFSSMPGSTTSYEAEILCAAGAPACVSGFWDGAFDTGVLGTCSVSISQVGDGLTAVNGTASCTLAADGSVTGTFNQSTRKLLVGIQFQQPAYGVAINANLSQGEDTLSGTWSCACGSGSLSLDRSLTRTSSFVDAQGGGMLTTASGDGLSIPAGALPADGVLKSVIQPVPALAPPGSVAISRAYDFGPDGTTFSEPVTAVFHYAEEDLAGGLVDPESLRVYVYDSQTQSWQLMGGVVDTVAKTITVQITHFSDYALFGSLTPGLDDDGDAVIDTVDNCQLIANVDQRNADVNFTDNPPTLTQDDTSRTNSDAAGDACDNDDDNDGLVDTTEATFPAMPGCTAATAVLDPMHPDTDGDGYMDGAECAIGTNPNNPSASPVGLNRPTADQCRILAGALLLTTDTDNDRIQDRIEVCGYGTSVTSNESDGDGVNDGCEVGSLNTLTVVNSGDQLLLSQAIVADLSGPFVWNADLNKDGANNSGDQLLLSQLISAGANTLGYCDPP